MAAEKTIILITGANSGIGYETSYTLADASPNNHVIMAARSTEKGQKALAELQARKPAGSLSFLNLDITSDTSIEAAAKAVDAEFGVVDVLMNNAAITDSTLAAGFKPVTRESLRNLFGTNVFGHTLLTQALEPLLKKSTNARIINMSSGLGSMGYRVDHSSAFNPPEWDVYRMTKAALNMMSANQGWRYRDWAKVWSFCPGFVMSNLSGEGDRETRSAMGAGSPASSAAGVLDLVQGKRDGDTKKFVSWDGSSHPW